VGNVTQEKALASLRQKIAAADAFLVVTPEYNHSYPAALKLVIDSVYEQWQAKPVAFVSYGGASGGIRAVEHLRQVFAELHAVSVRDSVSFANVWEHFSGEASPKEQSLRSIAVLLRQLKWWAAALHRAREASPYNQAAA
jgi:NAD(P)H-dependent FMN reductase